MRGSTAEGGIEVTVTWSDGRSGIFREGNGYSAKITVGKGQGDAGQFDGCEPLVQEFAGFFRRGKPPVPDAETLEIYALMEAADESKRRAGAPVSLTEVMEKARLK